MYTSKDDYESLCSDGDPLTKDEATSLYNEGTTKEDTQVFRSKYAYLELRGDSTTYAREYRKCLSELQLQVMID